MLGGSSKPPTAVFPVPPAPGRWGESRPFPLRGGGRAALWPSWRRRRRRRGGGILPLAVTLGRQVSPGRHLGVTARSMPRPRRAWHGTAIGAAVRLGEPDPRRPEGPTPGPQSGP